MKKVKIEIVKFGYLPDAVDLINVGKWKSELFEIVYDQNKKYPVPDKSDGKKDWSYSDKLIKKYLPSKENGSDVMIAVTNVPLKNNYFTRSFDDNRICMTYNKIAKVLNFNNIPLENLLLRRLYTTSLLYRMHGNRIPKMRVLELSLHDETRGCLLDMNGHKEDIIYSLIKPKLCSQCTEALKDQELIEKELIDKIQHELNQINKRLFFRIADFIKKEANFINNFIFNSVDCIGYNWFINRKSNRLIF